MYRSSKRHSKKKNRKKSSDSKGGSNGWNRICRARRVIVTQTTSIPGFHGNHVTRESGQKRGVEIPKRWKLAGATLKRRHGLFQVKGFQLEYLAKVPEVKDTVHKHSLLHHLCHMVMEKFPDSTDLYSEVRASLLPRRRSG